MIIFDLDGTLWNTVDATLKAANEIASENDEVKPFTRETIENGMGLSFDENLVNYMPYLDKEKSSIYLKQKDDRTVQIINEEGAILYDGVEDVIKSLSKNYKLGVITNSTDAYIKSFYKITGLQDYFMDYIGTATYGITKGEAIKKMADRNNEPNSYYVGDINKDKIATIEAGMIFIHAKYGFEPSVESNYFINDIKELVHLMENINK